MWVTPHGSAAHSTGTLWRMSLMKKTQVASGLRQCSRTVPVREVNLLPQQRLTSAAYLSRKNSSAMRPATSTPKGFALPI